MFEQFKDRIMNGGPVPLPVSAILTAATPATRIGMWWRLRQEPVKVNARVISYGNLTAGGTGKTPAVIERVQKEMDAGRRVAVLTRGYGAESLKAPQVVKPQGFNRRRWRRLGDEPVLIALRCPGVIISRASDRVAGAQAAIDEYGCDTLIMDDGYQHVRLARDENFCIIDASNPWGGGQLVPRGPLREPLSALNRATNLILTRCDQAGHLDGLVEELKQRCGDIPIRFTRHAPDGFYRMATGEAVDIKDIKNAQVRAICGIGRPQAFHRTLLDLGLDVPEPRVFGDHEVIRLDQCADADYIVVTEKDAVKLDANDERIVALRVALRDFTPE